MDSGSNKDPRAVPPFDATLLGVGASEVIAFDATIGRIEPLRRASPALPEVSVIFGSKSPVRSLASLGASVGADLEVVGLLGEGGMGVVHLAHQHSLDRDVALKTTRPDAPAPAVEALAAEAVMAGSLEHPNIVPVHAFGRTADGRPVLVMKRVEGVAWKELLHDPAHALWQTIGSSDRLVDHLQILAQVANALSFAHSRSIVHRDVKPENVMIGEFGEVYLVDFGLAIRVDEACAAPPSIVGSPAYMAPEMVAGFACDARTDVYLLGATLHEILTGRPPHEGDSLLSVLTAAYEAKAPVFDDSVSEELADVCARAMARAMDERHPSARAFRIAITDFVHHRASLLLSHEGDARLDDALRAIGDDALVRTKRRALLVEARFAYKQAVASWAGNRAAISGEQRCIAAEARLEIDEGHAPRARVLVDALSTKDVALVAALAGLEARLAREREEAEKMRRLAHDLDARVGMTTRRRVLLGIAALAAVVSAIIVRRYQAGVLTPRHLVLVATFMVLTMTIVVLTFRKRLLANEFGRRITALAYLSSVLMLVHRALAVWAGEPVHVVLAFDSFLIGAMLLGAAVTLARFLAFGALFTFTGAAIALTNPAAAPAAFSLSTIAMLVGAAVLWHPERADEERRS